VSMFVAMAEEKFNAELRVDRMIEFVDGTIASRCAPLPDDWLEMDMVHMANANGANGFLPIRYKARDEFFNLVDQNAINYYTIEGRQIYFGGTPDEVNGIQFKLWYYGEVPDFADTQSSWVYDKYPSLYTFCTLIHTDIYMQGEEPKAVQMKQWVEDQITKLNNKHLLTKASGSRVTMPRVRSFG